MAGETEVETYNYEYEQPETRKRPSDDQNNDRDRKRTNGGPSQPLLKLLVPNYVAGALIAKGGSNISELQSKYGCTIRISSKEEYYPGTGERVVVILGEESNLNDLNLHIMEKVEAVQSNPNSERKPSENERDNQRLQQVKIVLTNDAAGQIIGRGGATIKALQEESKAKITLSNREDSAVPGERLLKISGSLDQRLEACRQVIEKISADAGNMANGSTKYTNNGGGAKFHGGGVKNMQQNAMLSAMSNNTMQISNFGGLGIGGMSNQGILNQQGGLSNQGNSFSNQGFSGQMANQGTKSKLKTTVQIQVEVPDVLVGAVLGKGGSTLSEFHQFSGAKLVFSGKKEYAPGTTDRILTITGDLNQTQTAYFLVTQKVEQAQSQLGNYKK